MTLTDVVDRLVLHDWPDVHAPPSFESLHPVGLDRHAILLVESLSVVSETDNVADAIADEIDRSWRDALRPVDGRLPADARVVVFRNRAEAAAAYLVAVADGSATRQWWWSYLRELASGDAVSVLLAHENALAVVAHLVRWTTSELVLNRIPPEALLAVVRQIARQHHLSVTINGPVSSSETADHSRPRSTASHDQVTIERRGRTVVVGDRGAMVPTILEPLVRALSGGVVAQSRPDHRGREQINLEPPRRERGASTGQRHEHDGQPSLGSTDSISGDRQPVDPAFRALLPDGHDPVEGQSVSNEPARTRRRRTPTVTTGDSTRPGSEFEVHHRRGLAVDLPATAVPELARDEFMARGERRACIQSQIAGAFYLVNLLKAVNLEERGVGDEAPWDVFEATARALLPDVEDPMWDLTASLAMRSANQAASVDLQLACVDLAGDLEAGLELEDEEGSLADLISIPGLISFDATHLDIDFDLNQIQLPVRVRGLDMDPGWVGDLGRAIHFHYGRGLG